MRDVEDAVPYKERGIPVSCGALRNQSILCGTSSLFTITFYLAEGSPSPTRAGRYAADAVLATDYIFSAERRGADDRG